MDGWMHLHEKIVDVDVLSSLVIVFWVGSALFLFKRRFFLDVKNWIQCFLVQILLSLFSQIWKQHSLRIQAISKALPKIRRIDGRNIPSTE